MESVKSVKANELNWLGRFGSIGEYLKLEIKSMRRNKVVRKSFLVGLFCVLMFSILFAFTDVYDNSVFMECFIAALESILNILIWKVQRPSKRLSLGRNGVEYTGDKHRWKR